MVDQYGPIVIGTAVDDPMPDSEWTELEFVAQPSGRDQQCSRNVRNTLNRIGAVCQRIAGRSCGAQPGTASDAVHLALDLSEQPAVAVDREELKLDTGGSRIDDKDAVHGDHPATVGA